MKKITCNWCGRAHERPAQSAAEALAGCCKPVIKGASRVGVSPTIRVGSDGHVVRHVYVYDGDGRILHDLIVMSVDGVLPVDLSVDRQQGG